MKSSSIIYPENIENNFEVFLETHQSWKVIFSCYLWNIFFILIVLILKKIGLIGPTGNKISLFPLLKLIGCIPCCCHLYIVIQKKYFPNWKRLSLRMTQIGDSFIFLMSLSAATTLIYVSFRDDICNLPLCEKIVPGTLQPYILLQNALIPVLGPILVRAHSTLCVILTFFMSFGCTIYSAVLVKASSTAYLVITALYVLEAIVLYSNELTIWQLYVSYINQEELLTTKMKSKNDQELLTLKKEELRYLFGSVAHDLKSPLQGFITELETLHKRLLRDSQSSESIVVLRSICSFMLMMINRAVDYSKISSGLKLSPSYSTINLLDTIQWAIKCSTLTSDSVPVVLEEISDNICVNIITEKNWIMENILCLISNAQKFTSFGSIQVRCFLETKVGGWIPQYDTTLETGFGTTNQMIRIEVEDSGIGISFEERETLFQPFKHTQKRVGGTGLGLYSLLKRIEYLGGNCGVLDRNDKNTGSRFWFTFPYHPDKSNTIVSHANLNIDSISIPFNGSVDQITEISQREKDFSILVVEDSLVIQKTIRRALLSEGFQRVDIAKHGQECLDFIQLHDYDFILMDIQMPVMGGIEATIRIRQNEELKRKELSRKEVNKKTILNSGKDIDQMDLIEWGEKDNDVFFDASLNKQIIIGISANSDNQTVQEALNCGMDAFLAKPLEMNSLKECFSKFNKRRLLKKKVSSIS